MAFATMTAHVGALLLPSAVALRAPHHVARRVAGDARLGLLDWMLDTPYASPVEQLCRAEGWDCIGRVPASVVHQSEGPRSYALTLNFGVRFRKDGRLSLVAPSTHFAGEDGAWEALALADDGQTPTRIRWQLATGARGICDSGEQALVEPTTLLFGSFRLDEDAGASLLRDGELWTEEEGERRSVGSCDASPMPLAGSN